jgi:aconitase B
MVEATEGSNINQGKSAKRVKSTKFVKQILSTCITLFMISKFAKVQMIAALKGSFNFTNLLQNLHAKRQGGGG